MLSLLATVVLAASSLDASIELQLIPISGQINTLHSEHLGSGGRLSIRLNRYFAGYFAGAGHWYSSPSRAQDELNRGVVRVDVGRQTQVHSTWQATMGIESIPLSGTVRFLTLHEGEFGLVLRAGLGLGGARIRLMPPSQARDGTMSAATFGDAGVRLLGDFGVAFRFGIGPFAIHLGSRLSMWSDELNTVNGCNSSDLSAMDSAIRSGRDRSAAAVGRDCAGFSTNNDVAPAVSAVRGRPGGLVTNVAAELGVSWAF